MGYIICKWILFGSAFSAASQGLIWKSDEYLDSWYNTCNALLHEFLSIFIVIINFINKFVEKLNNSGELDITRLLRVRSLVYRAPPVWQRPDLTSRKTTESIIMAPVQQNIHHRRSQNTCTERAICQHASWIYYTAWI